MISFMVDGGQLHILAIVYKNIKKPAKHFSKAKPSAGAMTK